MIATAEYWPANTAATPTDHQPGRVVELPLDHIEDDPANERPNLQDGLAELAQSIEKQGLIEPVLVYAVAPHRYRLQSGHRRRAAVATLGWPTIPALVVIGPASDREQHIRRLVANAARRDIDPLTKARTLKALLDTGLKQTELAPQVGLTQSGLANLVRLLSLPEAVQALVAAEKLSPSAAHELLALDEPDLHWDGTEHRFVAASQVALAKRAVEEGMSAKNVRAAVAQQKQHNAYCQREAAARRQREAEIAARRKAATPEQQAEIAATQAKAAAQKAREEAAREREKTRLAAREQTAAATIDALLGYDPTAPPNLEVLRLAAMVCMYGAHVPYGEHAAWQRRIETAADPATLLQLIVEAGRAGLALDPDRRALGYGVSWEFKQWADKRWGLNAALADALLGEKLINARTHEALLKEAAKGPWPGRGAPPAPAPAAAPPDAAPPPITPDPAAVAAWLDLWWTESIMPVCRLCGAESSDPAAYVQPRICHACAPTLAARYTATTPDVGRCDRCGGGVYLAYGTTWCPRCDQAAPAPPVIIAGWMAAVQARAGCRTCGVASRDTAFYIQPGLCHGCGPSPVAIPDPLVEGAHAAA